MSCIRDISISIALSFVLNCCIMVSNSPNVLRIIKAMEYYKKTKPHQFDTGMVLNKLKIISASDGQFKGTLTVERNMCNMMDTIHGGYISSIIDTITMFANSTHHGGRFSWTTSLHVSYLNAARLGDQLSVTTTPIKAGNASVMEAIIDNDTTGESVAKGTAAFLQASDNLNEKLCRMLNIDDIHE